MNEAYLMEGYELRGNLIIVRVTSGRFSQTAVTLPDHLHNDHVPPTWQAFEAVQCWSKVLGSTSLMYILRVTTNELDADLLLVRCLRGKE